MSIRGDTYAVSQRFWEFSGIFTSPVRLTIALVFLYQYVALLLSQQQLVSYISQQNLGMECFIRSRRHSSCLCGELPSGNLQHIRTQTLLVLTVPH